MLTPEQLKQAKQQYTQQYGKPTLNATATEQQKSLKGNDYFDSLKTQMASRAEEEAKAEAKANEPGLLSRVGTDVNKRMKQGFNALAKEGFRTDASSNMKRMVGLGGAGAGLVNDVGGEVVQSLVGALPDSVKKSATDFITNTLGPENIKMLGEMIGQGQEKFGEFEEAHPEGGQLVRDAANIATVIPVGKGAAVGAQGMKNTAVRTATELAENIAPSMAPELAALSTKTGVNMTDDAVKAALALSKDTPSFNELTSGISKGTKTKSTGILRTKEVVPSARDLERANAIAPLIDPKASRVENIGKLREGIVKEAEDLKKYVTDNDGVFKPNELKAHLKGMELPLEVASDATLKRTADLALNKFMYFVNQQKNNLSGLLEARKQFDIWARKAIPSLYTSERMVPIRDFLKAMRNGANDFIETGLPKDSPFRASLGKQNLMYEAIDNIAPAAAKEVGTTGPQRFLQAHPTLDKVKDMIPSGILPRGLK